jgi:DHA2 family multidrug resistance protein
LTADAGMDNTFFPRMLVGFGMGLMFVPLSQLTLSVVPREELAGATGLSQLVRQLGGSLGVAIIMTLLARQTTIAWTALDAGVTRSQGVPLTTIMNMLSQNASVMAYDYVFRICALLFIAAIPILFLVGRKRTPAAASVASQAMAEAA